MARPKGSKMVECPNPKCTANIVGLPGDSVTCKKCGKKFKITNKMLKEQGKL